MPRKKISAPLGSFGPRYGSTLRKRVGRILAEARRWHPCPRCKALRVRRVAVGIWQCRKCGFKFAGGAYSPTGEIK